MYFMVKVIYFDALTCLLQYSILRQREHINSLIEEAILEAEEKGTTVLTLGLLNQVSSV